MEIKIDQIVNIEEIKGDVNLLLFNMGLVQEMNIVNQIMGALKDVKIKVCDN